MLIATLNHNLPKLTDNIYNQLQNCIRDKDEIIVVDNGSETKNIAKNTTHRLESNIFFGGGVNVILDYFLNETNQDYLFILNNDLIFHGHNILETIENEISENKLDVYSPSIINASIEQCYWKQMHNWNTGNVRLVKWIDFQAPVLSREICNIIKEYPSELIYGWGLDFYTGIIAEEYNMKTGVSDNIVFTHLDGQTFKQDKINIGLNEFCQRAEYNMNRYFNNNKLYLQLRNYGEFYEI